MNRLYPIFIILVLIIVLFSFKKEFKNEEVPNDEVVVKKEEVVEIEEFDTNKKLIVLSINEKDGAFYPSWVKEEGVYEQIDQYVKTLYKETEGEAKELFSINEENVLLPFQIEMNISKYKNKSDTSILLSIAKNSGGAHNSIEIKTWSYDKNNKVLSLEDYVKKIGYQTSYDFSEKLYEKLITDYSEEIFPDVLEKISKAQTNKTNIFNENDYTWVVSENGILVQFNPYSIAPFSSGIISFEI